MSCATLAGVRTYLRFFVVAVLSFAILALPLSLSARAQWGSLCPAGSTPVNAGGGMMCMCPDGSYANYGQACAAAAPRCPANTQECGNYCCGAGRYCSKYGCTPQGAVDCGNHFCNPGEKCSRSGGCLAQNRVDCGGYNCPEGNKCGNGHRACLPMNSVDCGAGHGYCDAGHVCTSDDHCITEAEDRRRKAAAAEAKQKAAEQRQAELERRRKGEDARKATLKQQLADKLRAAQAAKEEQRLAAAKKKEDEASARRRALEEQATGRQMETKVRTEVAQLKTDLAKLQALQQNAKAHQTLSTDEKASMAKMKEHIAQTMRDLDQKDKYIAQQKTINDLTLKANIVSIKQQEYGVGAIKAAVLFVPITGEYVGAVTAGRATTLTYVAGKTAVTELMQKGMDKLLEAKGVIPNESDQNIVLRMTVPLVGLGTGAALEKGGELIGYPIQVIIQHEYLKYRQQ